MGMDGVFGGFQKETRVCYRPILNQMKAGDHCSCQHPPVIFVGVGHPEMFNPYHPPALAASSAGGVCRIGRPARLSLINRVSWNGEMTGMVHEECGDRCVCVRGLW